MRKTDLFSIFIFLSILVTLTGGCLITWRFVDEALITSFLRQSILKVHIISSVIFLVILGMMAVEHFLPHIKKGMRKARKSGLSLLAFIILMIASGFGLQVISSVRLLEFNYWVHVLTGLFFYVIFIIHRLQVAHGNVIRIHVGWVAVIIISLVPLLETYKPVEEVEDDFLLDEESSEERKAFKSTFLLMGSKLSVRFVGIDRYALFDKVASECLRLEDEISHYRDDSAIGKLNTNLVNSVQLSEQALSMYQMAELVKLQSRGAFNPEYKDVTQGVPGKACFTLLNQRLEKACQHSSLDYGAIGKGAALDVAMDILSSADCIELNFAGQIAFNYVSSSCSEPDNYVFRDVPGVIQVSEAYGSISTSGNLGKSLSGINGHIYDPSKGSLKNYSYATVVFHKSAALADAWSTAFYVLGPTEALEIAKQKEINVLFVFQDGSHVRSGNVLDYMPAL